MSIVLELTPAEEEALRQGAARAGVDMPSFLITSALDAAQREADEWTRWEIVGKEAANEACDMLIKEGIGYVYGKEGKVYRRTAEGVEELVSPTNEEA
jgi:hypothetical protein